MSALKNAFKSSERIGISSTFPVSAAVLAARSANSLPIMPICPGIQINIFFLLIHVDGELKREFVESADRKYIHS